jgi:succinate dehydrogenase / fumarate reductase flavoprotein subunit
VPKKKGDDRAANDIPEDERDYYLERRYPSFGNLVPRDVASRNAKAVCDEGRGVGDSGLAVYLDFAEAIQRLGENTIKDKYGNLFDMYARITGDNPYKTPMRIYPAVHYTMGGLWVDYNLMSTIPGLFVLGEANFSDHGANRLGASALMQGLADGYFVIPFTIGDYLAKSGVSKTSTEAAEFTAAEQNVKDGVNKLLAIKGEKTPNELHRDLGLKIWEYIGMGRNEAGLKKFLNEIPAMKDEFRRNLKIPAEQETLNKNLEFAGRIADYYELAELMAKDALDRKESCGGHFREESQTEEGEAKRDDDNFTYVSAWEYTGEGSEPRLNKEPLTFENVKLTQRSYK